PPLTLHSFPTRRSSDLRRTAVAIGALVGNRRHERVQKITVRHVELDGIEPETDRALGGVHESRADAVDILLRHLARRRPGGAERDRKSTRLNSSHVKIS